MQKYREYQKKKGTILSYGLNTAVNIRQNNGQAPDQLHFNSIKINTISVTYGF